MGTRECSSFVSLLQVGRFFDYQNIKVYAMLGNTNLNFYPGFLAWWAIFDTNCVLMVLSTLVFS